MNIPLAEIGRVRKAVGRLGELRVIFELEFVPLIPSLKFVFLESHGFPVPYRIEWIEPLGRDHRIKLKYIETPEDAYVFAGKSIWVEESKAPKALKEGWRIEKFLPGFILKDSDGHTLGVIVKVEEYPMQRMMFVEDDRAETHLVPYVEEWIIRLDRENRHLVMELPKGLF